MKEKLSVRLLLNSFKLLLVAAFFKTRHGQRERDSSSDKLGCEWIVACVFSEAPRDFGDVDDGCTAGYIATLLYTSPKSRNVIVVHGTHNASTVDLLGVPTLCNRFLYAGSRWSCSRFWSGWSWGSSFFVIIAPFFTGLRTTVIREFLLPLCTPFYFLLLQLLGLDTALAQVFFRKYYWLISFLKTLNNRSGSFLAGIFFICIIFLTSGHCR